MTPIEEHQEMIVQMQNDYEELDDIQKGQLQYLINQVKEPSGMRSFVIPRSGLMDSYKFPYFMSLFLEWESVELQPVFDMRNTDVVLIDFY